MTVMPAEIASGTRAQQRLRSRQRLLEVAVERMAERGTAGTSVQDVASRAGFTSGAVYHQFSSREDLVHAASSYALASYPKLDEIAAAAGSVREFFVTSAAAAMHMLDDASLGTRELLRVQLHLLLAADHEAYVREAVTAFIEDQLDDLTDRIRHTAVLCEETLLADPEILAREFLALLRGFMLLRLVDPMLADDVIISAAVTRLALSATAPNQA